MHPISALGQRDWIIANAVVSKSVTGTLVKTPLETVSIPGGLLELNGAIEIEVIYFISSSVSGKEFIIDYGGTEFMHVGHVTAGYYKFNTVIRNAGSLSAQQALNPDSPAGDPSLKNGTVNTVLPQPLVFSGLLLDAGDTITLVGYTVKVINPL